MLDSFRKETGSVCESFLTSYVFYFLFFSQNYCLVCEQKLTFSSSLFLFKLQVCRKHWTQHWDDGVNCCRQWSPPCVVDIVGQVRTPPFGGCWIQCYLHESVYRHLYEHSIDDVDCEQVQLFFLLCILFWTLFFTPCKHTVILTTLSTFFFNCFSAFQSIFPEFLTTMGVGNGVFVDFTTGWYAKVGSAFCLTMLLSTVTPNLLTWLRLCCMDECKRTAMRKQAVTQRQLNIAYSGAVFKLEYRYPTVRCNPFILKTAHHRNLPDWKSFSFFIF